jgi:hypothetical protein
MSFAKHIEHLDGRVARNAVRESDDIVSECCVKPMNYCNSAPVVVSIIYSSSLTRWYGEESLMYVQR